jgi:RNA polymerase sigma factor (sigma-70 family)
MELLPGNRAILDGFRRADSEALEKIYRFYLKAVIGLLRSGFAFESQGKSLRFQGYVSPEDIEDAVQETFILAFSESARSGYDGLRPFSSYLLGIARNVVLNRFRRDVSRLDRFTRLDAEPGRAALESGDFPSAEPLANAAQAYSYEAERIQKAVEEFVSTLDEAQRRILRAHFLEERSQEDTAREAGVDRNRVRKEIRAIRLRLYRFLKSRGLEHCLSAEASFQEGKT